MGQLEMHARAPQAQDKQVQRKDLRFEEGWGAGVRRQMTVFILKCPGAYVENTTHDQNKFLIPDILILLWFIKKQPFSPSFPLPKLVKRQTMGFRKKLRKT